MKCVSVHLGYIDVFDRFLKFAFKKTKHSKLQDSTEVNVAIYVFKIYITCDLHKTSYLVFHSFIICDVVSVLVISFVIPLQKPSSCRRECKG